MLLKKTKSLFIFGILVFQTYLFAQQKNINITAAIDSVSLYHNSQIAYTNTENFSPKNINNLAFSDFNQNTVKTFPFPDSLQYAVIKFKIRNLQNANIKIYLTAKEDISYLDAYQLKGEKYQLVGKTCYANSLSSASIQGNEHQLILNLQKNSEYAIFLFLKKYKYTIQLPEIHLLSHEKYTNEVVKKSTGKLDFFYLFTTIISGFQLALLIYGVFRICFFGYKRIYFFFSLQCLLFILFYLSEINLLVFETQFLPFVTNKMVYEALGDVFIISFNFLIISFFDLEKNSFLYKYLTRISIFWLILLFVEALPYYGSPTLIIVCRFILNTAAIVDFVTLSFILYYAFYHRNEYGKYLFIGILIMMISSFEIAFPRFLNLLNLNPNWIKISKTSYLLLQVCDNINFCFVLLGFIVKEKELFLEKNKMENQYRSTFEELKKIKKLVEDEHIVLKDKTRVSLKNLSHIKVDDHYLNLYTIEGKNYMVRGKLAEIMEEMPNNFVKCHRSYIVNKNHIKQMQGKFILMLNNSEIPISRGFKL